MNREMLIAAGIDYDAALRRFVGKTDLYEKYLIRFLEDQNLCKLETEIKSKNCKAAFKAAHALKGVVGTLGITRLLVVVGKCVEALRAGELEAAEEMMPEIREEYEAVICAIKG